MSSDRSSFQDEKSAQKCLLGHSGSGPASAEIVRNIERLGQVFTPPVVVHAMLSMRKNSGSILEPSAGNGAFMSALDKNAVGIELDERFVTDQRVSVGDFFAYPLTNRFDTIIGNPPYVRFQDIRKSTKRLLSMEWFDRRSNLYLFFIAKCMHHLDRGGELIFITPRDFMKSTSAKQLNAELYAQGSFTHFQETGDAAIFEGASPNCAIWRWEKGRKSKKTSNGDKFCYQDGQIWFGDEPAGERLGDFCDVKVGAVSGADAVFANKRCANVEMVCSKTRSTGETRKMIYNKKCACIEPYKEMLLNRKIRQFDESNWWEWGRGYHHQEGERVYVNCKTRNPKPFFPSEEEAYDGSVLAVFPKEGVDAGKLAHKLNKVDWQKYGFVCDGRLMFTQKSLVNAPVGAIL